MVKTHPEKTDAFKSEEPTGIFHEGGRLKPAAVSAVWYWRTSMIHTSSKPPDSSIVFWVPNQKDPCPKTSPEIRRFNSNKSRNQRFRDFREKITHQKGKLSRRLVNHSWKKSCSCTFYLYTLNHSETFDSWEIVHFQKYQCGILSGKKTVQKTSSS